MAVTVRIPTQLRELSGGASEVTVDGGTVAAVLAELEPPIPASARASSTRRAAAPLRERLRRRRGHPLPRRREHPRHRRPNRQHRPRRSRRLTNARRGTSLSRARRATRAKFVAATSERARTTPRRRGERSEPVARQERAAAAQVSCAAANDELAGTTHMSWATFFGTSCSPVSLSTAHTVGAALDHDRVRSGDELRFGEEHERALVDLDLLADAPDDDGPGRRLREGRGRAALDLVRWNRGSGSRAGTWRGRRGAARAWLPHPPRSGAPTGRPRGGPSPIRGRSRRRGGAPRAGDGARSRSRPRAPSG